MKNRIFSSLILSAFLAACLTVSMTGCSSSSDSANSSAAPVSSTASSKTESKTSEEETSAEESSEASKESKAASSKEESSEVSVPKIMDTEKDITIYTLSVKEIPYQKGLFNSTFENYENVTVITYLVDSDYMSDFSNMQFKRVDERPEKNYETSERLFMTHVYNMKHTEGYSDRKMCYGIIITANSAKPSDYYFSWKYDTNEYKLTFSDEVSDFPEQYYTADEAKVCNVVNLDGEPYFFAGCEYGTVGGGSLSGEAHHTEYAEKPLSLRRVHIDGVSKLDLSKFSYEPDEGLDRNHDLSKITVAIEEVEKYSNYDTQCIQLRFFYEYDEGQYTDEELKAIDKTQDLLFQYGYLVYNGENGKVRIDI